MSSRPAGQRTGQHTGLGRALSLELVRVTERAAVAGVAHSEAVVLAMQAKVKQAEADVVEANAEVEVAQADAGQ